MNMKSVLLFLLLFYHVHAICQASDYLSVFGSDLSTDITIDTFVHDFATSVGYIAVAGYGTISGVSASFAYVIDYNTNCQVLSKQAWIGNLGVSPGITSVSLSADGTKIFMVAYEILATEINEYLLYATTSGLGSTTAFLIEQKATLTTDDFILPAQGIVGNHGDYVFLLHLRGFSMTDYVNTAYDLNTMILPETGYASTTASKYRAARVSTDQYAFIARTKAPVLIISVLDISTFAGLTYDGTEYTIDHSLVDAEEYPVRMGYYAGNVVLTSVEIVTCLNVAVDSTTVSYFDWLSHVNKRAESYATTTWQQCYAAEIAVTNVGQFLTRDSTHTFYVTIIDFSTGATTISYLQTPVRNVQNWSATSLNNYAVYHSADFIYADYTNFIVEKTFLQNLGYVASWQTYGKTASKLVTTATSTAVFTSTDYSGAVNTKTSSFTNRAMTQRNMVTKTADIITGNLVAFAKNWWVAQLCPSPTGLTSEHIYCIYYDLFDYLLFTYSFNPRLGLVYENGDCFNQAETMSATYLSSATHAICFPRYTKTFTTWPTLITTNVATVNDANNFQFTSELTYLDIPAYGSVTIVTGQDCDAVTREEFRGYGQVIVALNYNVTAYIGQENVYTSWLPSIHAYQNGNRTAYSNTCNSTVTCMSNDCADQVSFDVDTRSFNTGYLNSEMYGETHIYTVVVSCDDSIYRTDAATYMVFVRSLTDITSPINIWLPTTIFYRIYNTIPPYQMVEPYDFVPDRPTVQVSRKEAAVAKAEQPVVKIKEVPDNWTAVDRIIAFNEAKDRYENPLKDKVTIQRMLMDQNGTLTIMLSGEVRFPSYMYKEVAQRNTKGRRLQGGAVRAAVNAAVVAQVQANVAARTADADIGANVGTVASADGTVISTLTSTGSSILDGVSAQVQTSFMQRFGRAGETIQDVIARFKERERKIQEEQNVKQDNQEQLIEETAPEQVQDSGKSPDELQKEALSVETEFKQIQCKGTTNFLDQDLRQCVQLVIYFGTIKDQIHLDFITETQNRLVTWKVIGLTKQAIQIQLYFSEPELVSRADKLEVKLDISQIEGQTQKLNQDLKLVGSTELKILETKSTFVQIADAGTTAVQVAVVATSFAKTLLVGSLAQVWGMINSLQFIIHLPLFTVEIPEKTMNITGKIVQLATFDIPKLNVKDLLSYAGGDFPVGEDHINGLEDPRLVEKLGQLEYQSRHVSENMGSVFLFFTLSFFGLVLMVILEVMQSMLPAPVRKFHFKLKKFLLWNFIIRLYLEAAIELTISTILNLRFGQLTGVPWAATVNYVFAWWCAGVYLLSPFAIYIFYTRNFSLLEDENFIAIWGDIYDGLNTEKRTAVYLPIIFIVKRVAFCVIVLYLNEHPELQIHAQLVLTMFMAGFLFHTRPYKLNLMNNLEIFNEIYTVIILIEMTLFCDGYSTAVKIYAGYLFIANIAIIMVVQLFFLLREMRRDLKISLQRRQYVRKYKRWYADLSVEMQDKEDLLREQREKTREEEKRIEFQTTTEVDIFEDESCIQKLQERLGGEKYLLQKKVAKKEKVKKGPIQNQSELFVIVEDSAERQSEEKQGITPVVDTPHNQIQKMMYKQMIPNGIVQKRTIPIFKQDFSRSDFVFD